MIGKDEKSIGVAVWMATMMIKSASMMLKVNKTSSITGGMGNTRSVSISRTKNGVTSELSGKALTMCRKFVSEKSIDSITY